MTDHNTDPRAARLAAARAKAEERRIAHAKHKQHLRDTAVPIKKTDNNTP